MDTEFNTKVLYNHIKTQTEIKNKSREKIYNKVLLKIQKKIFKESSTGIFSILYEIPKFIIGEPLYSVYKCAEYIAYNLGSNGFKIKLFDKKELKDIFGIKKPQSPVILISWEHLKYNQQINNQHTQQLTNQITNQISNYNNNNNNYNNNNNNNDNNNNYNNDNQLNQKFSNISLMDEDTNKYIYINNKNNNKNKY